MDRSVERAGDPGAHSCRAGLRPPSQDSQRTKRVPAAGRTDPFQGEPGPAFIGVLQRPTAVFTLVAPYYIDRLGKALVTRRVGSSKIVERAENVVVPAWWKGELKENRFDDFARAVGTEKAVLEKKLAPAALRCLYCGRVGTTV